MFLYQASQPAKVRKRTQGSTNSARTEEVFEHIAAAAIPPNPKALARVKELLEKGADRNEISKELIGDPGLGLYYLTHIRSALQLESLPEDPLAPITTMSDTQLRSLFDVTASQISKHRLSEAAPPQLLRLQHTFIASNTATNLARQLSVDQGKAFSLVQLNQSALNLMAWSYPAQFHKALFNQRRFKSSLEESLNSLVGVKTDNIVNKLARRIGLPTSLLLDLQMSQRSGLETSLSLASNPSPLNLAKVGELLAKANDKEHYPDALALWDKVENEIEQRGLENPRVEIHESIRKFAAELGAESGLPYHMALFPELGSTTQNKSTQQQEAATLNPHIRKVPQGLQSTFEKCYLALANEGVSVAGLHTVIEELVPMIGVLSGCLYLAQGEKSDLNPVLHFGKTKRHRPSLGLYASHPVAQSLFSNFPQQFESEPGVMSICSSLPECKKQAVLVIDFDVSSYQLLNDKMFPVFNALSLTLVDVMGQRLHR